MSKPSKHRACPVVGREISAAECGESRISRHACPVDCPHLPFTPANYESFLATEGDFDLKAEEWMSRTPALAEAMHQAAREADRLGTPSSVVVCYAWLLTFQRDAAGLTALDHWERAGFPGLKNDGRVIARARRQMRMALVEIHRVLEDRVEVVDLLDPERGEFTIVDHSLATQATRFAVLLLPVYPLPHFWRAAGAGLSVPLTSDMDARDVVIELVRHLGGPTDVPSLRSWLLQHFLRFEAAMDAVETARRERMYQQMDATFGKAVYALEASGEECLARLQTRPDSDVDQLTDEERAEGFEAARVWFSNSPGSGAEVLGQPVVQGRILMRPGHWRLEALGKEHFAKLRSEFESLMGALVKFAGERLDNLGAQMLNRHPRPYDAALVPPKLLEHTSRVVLASSRVPNTGGANQAMARAKAEDLKGFLDRPVPMFDGLTPRAAAQVPALRPRLVRLMKDRICAQDREDLKSGTATDLSWALRELGLNELIVEPPAWQKDNAEAVLSASERRSWDQMVSVRPPAPRLGHKPLTSEEVLARFRENETYLSANPSPERAMEEAALDTLRNLESVAGQEMSEFELEQLAEAGAQAWLTLVTAQCSSPVIPAAELQKEYNWVMDEVSLLSEDSSENPWEVMTKACAQPAVLAFVLYRPTNALRNAESDQRRQARGFMQITLLTIALINVLTYRLQEPG